MTPTGERQLVALSSGFKERFEMDFVGPRELDVKSSLNMTEANFTPF